MQITEVEYSALFNLGNYNNEKISFTAKLEEGESPDEAIAKLREKAIATAANGGLGDVDDIYSRLCAYRRELREVEAKTENARVKWNETAEFLRAQGINPDAPNLVVNALMPAADEESTSMEPEVIF